nr:deoxyribodipyrimidine photo-lyase [Angustibacter aerolatus]
MHVTADAGPYGRQRDEAVDTALGEVPLARTGTPYAVGPGTVTKGDGTPFKVFTPFYRTWKDHGWPAPAGPPPKGLRWATSVDSQPLPDEPDLGGLEPAARRRGLRARPLAHLPRRRSRPLRRRARPARPRRHVAPVGAPEVRRGAPPHAAPRPGRAPLAGAERYRSEPGLARVLRGRAVAPAAHRPRVPQARDGRHALQRAGARLRRLVRGAHRLPVRRRRHAPPARGRLGAQQGAHGRGLVPRQGPARRVAARCAVLHAVAARRRPGEQQPRLAVGGRQRHRRLPVLPRVQPGHPGPEVRPGRRVRAPLGARACATSRARPRTRPGTPRTGTPTTTPSASSTTPSSGRRHSTATPRCARRVQGC